MDSLVHCLRDADLLAQFGELRVKELRVDNNNTQFEEVSMSTHALDIVQLENEKAAPRKELRVYCWTCLFFAGLTTLAFYVMLTFPAFEL